MRVDFHTHSTASDGTLSPAELAAAGAQAGLQYHALTDHDCVEGVAPFSGIPGVELSVEAGPHFDTFHLLGLGIDPNYPPLAGFLAKVVRDRDDRNRRIIANFNRLGFEMGEEIFGYARGKVLARPHFANWLVDRGYAPTGVAAFEKYLLPTSPAETRCYEERVHPTQAQSIEMIHAAGGLAILAHPKFGRKEWRQAGPDYAVVERGLAELQDMGLDGVEAFYQANTVDENITLTRIADKLGLLKSAGSDFHGANKPTVTLGMEVEERFIAPLIERLGLGEKQS